MTQALLWAAGGTGFTALMTALGAATVFLFRHHASQALHRILLGFAAGVMIAASMWSLLIPAIEQAEEMGLAGWLPAAGGSAAGIAFLLGMGSLLPRLSPESFHCRAVAVTRAPSARKRAASWLPMRPYPTTRHRLPSRACSVFSIAT